MRPLPVKISRLLTSGLPQLRLMGANFWRPV